MSNKHSMIEVNSPDEVPVFKTRDAERRFWETHSLGPRFPVTRGQGSIVQQAIEAGALSPAPRKRTKRAA
jgi:hypothetical protein